MDINNIKEYIDTNITEIGISVNSLASKFSIPASTAHRKFRSAYGETIRQYIVRGKLVKAEQLLSSERIIKNSEVMAIIAWPYTERSFRKLFNTYFNKSPKSKTNMIENEELPEVCSFRNKEVLQELLLRLVLYFEIGQVVDECVTSKTIRVDIDQTNFRFSIVQQENEWHFPLLYIIEEDRLAIRFFTTRLFSEKEAFVPNHLEWYFRLINDVAKLIKGEVGFDLRDSIDNWNYYVKNEMSINGLFPKDFTSVVLNEPLEEVIHLNGQSEFIMKTDISLREIKDGFIEKVSQQVERNFGIELTLLIDIYNQIISEDQEKFKTQFVFLFSLNLSHEVKLNLIDLILRLISYETLSDIESEEYKIKYSLTLLQKICTLGNVNLIASFIVAFSHKLKVQDISEESECESPEVILHHLLRKF